MKAFTRLISALFAALCILSLTLAVGASPSTAAEDESANQAAVKELQRTLEELDYDGDISEEALKEEFESSPNYETYGNPALGSSTSAAPNGCSTPKVAKKLTKKWDEVFKSVCNTHDKCYSKNSTKSRKTCDDSFRASMKNVCVFRKDMKTCKKVADIYYYSVRAFGESNYKGKGSSK